MLSAGWEMKYKVLAEQGWSYGTSLICVEKRLAILASDSPAEILANSLPRKVTIPKEFFMSSAGWEMK